MKVMTVLGTRPEIIRLSRIIPLLDAAADHVFVFTGQNSHHQLSSVFFRELSVRAPDLELGLRSSGFAEQLSELVEKIGQAIRAVKPSRLLILGDTNSGLSAIVAARMGVPVYHMEAGNRCFDRSVPEEVNRVLIDHCSDVLLPYTYRSMENLLREGIPRDRIFVTGNPIREVIEANRDQIGASRILEKLALVSGGYFLATVHRAETVDNPQRLRSVWKSLEVVADSWSTPVVVSVHPRTRERLKQTNVGSTDRVILAEPMGFHDFLRLETSAKCVLTDSGTVQEECSILQIPSVTLRTVTERPETLEAGSNILAGIEPAGVSRGVRLALDKHPAWDPPSEYMALNVSHTVANLVLSGLGT